VTRAAEAFAGEGGTIVLRAGMGRLFRRDLGRLYLAESLSEGMYAHVEVEDDGPALTVDAQERLFEPGDAASPGGLELAAVLGIVRGHGGALEVATEEVRGTRVRVCLPPAGAFEVEEPVQELPQPQGAVLVVDDEEQVRSVARLTLQRFGWPCMVARSGEEGIALFAEHLDGIAVVLLDVSLPGLSGAETLERLRQLKADVKVVLSSGYEASEALRGITVGKDVSFLRKPWRPTALLKVLRESVEQR
jgi:CheY-like chemotaxis protein